MHTLLEQYSEDKHRQRYTSVTKDRNINICENRNSKNGLLHSPRARCTSIHTPIAACINPWAPETPLLLATHRLLDPEVLKYSWQPAGKDVVKVVAADQCVTAMSLILFATCRELERVMTLLQELWGASC